MKSAREPLSAAHQITDQPDLMCKNVIALRSTHNPQFYVRTHYRGFTLLLATQIELVLIPSDANLTSGNYNLDEYNPNV